MKIEPIRAATNAPQRMSSTFSTAAAVPTRTGAIAAGRVRGRAAISQMRGFKASRTFRELREVRAATLLVGVAPLLALLGHVEEERRVVRQLLDAGEPVLGGVEARLEQAQGEGGEARHLTAPGHRLALEVA